MKQGDKVISTQTGNVGIIVSDKEHYSSWGELHMYVKWHDGTVEYHPVKMLNILE